MVDIHWVRLLRVVGLSVLCAHAVFDSCELPGRPRLVDPEIPSYSEPIPRNSYYGRSLIIGVFQVRELRDRERRFSNVLAGGTASSAEA